VRREVVENHVHVEAGGDLLGELVEEFEKLRRPVAAAALADDLASRDIERCEQGCRAGSSVTRTREQTSAAEESPLIVRLPRITWRSQ
jgi:hypothetical protein